MIYSVKIIKSLEGDEDKWSLKIEQNIVNIKPAILLSLIKTQSNLSKQIKLFIESLILAQDERWRRA